MKLLQSLRKPFLKLVSPRHRAMYAAHRQFRAEDGERKRYDYPFLNADSVVIDLGGYHGEWAEGIFIRYQPTVHIFEPHPVFAAQLTEKYRYNPKLQVHACALSSTDGEFTLSDMADGSSSQRMGSKTHQCRSVEAGPYLKSIGVDSVDLIKINIEGGEYDILPQLGRIGFLPRIRTIQVQFHLFEQKNVAQRDAIRDELKKTHHESWCYPFIWEQWDRR